MHGRPKVMKRDCQTQQLNKGCYGLHYNKWLKLAKDIALHAYIFWL